MSTLPYSEQQERESRRADAEDRANADLIGWSYDPDDLRTEVDTILHSFSTRKLGAAESLGAMAALAMRAIKQIPRVREAEHTLTEAECQNVATKTLDILTGDHQYARE